MSQIFPGSLKLLTFEYSITTYGTGPTPVHSTSTASFTVTTVTGLPLLVSSIPVKSPMIFTAGAATL